MDCTLPVTGIDGSAVAIAALALLLIGGLILGIARRSRGIGALAVVGLAILGGGALSTAPAAQAATTADCASPAASEAPATSAAPVSGTPSDDPATTSEPTPTPTVTATPTPTPSALLGSITITWPTDFLESAGPSVYAVNSVTQPDGTTTNTVVDGVTVQDLRDANCGVRTEHSGIFFTGVLNAAGVVAAVHQVTDGSSVTFDNLPLGNYTPFVSASAIGVGAPASAIDATNILAFGLTVSECSGGTFTYGGAQVGQSGIGAVIAGEGTALTLTPSSTQASWPVPNPQQ